MNTMRRYWFGLTTGLFVLAFCLLFLLVLLAPRQDAQKRGFIPCTEKMAEHLLNCGENKIWCSLKVIVQNSWCDMKVVGHGFAAWMRGKQDMPWSNYIFVPEPVEDELFDAEARADYLKNNPAFAEEMLQLKKLSEELEHEEDAEHEISPEEQHAGMGFDGTVPESAGSAGGEGSGELRSAEQNAGAAL